ncbi:hypothetical protein SRHO_G00314090 [Serrasalmus rhombeus]
MGIEHGPAVRIMSRLKKHIKLSDTTASFKQEMHNHRQTNIKSTADASAKTESQRHFTGRTEKDNQLETNERTDIADFIRFYGDENALKITSCILKKIPWNDIVESLTKDIDHICISSMDSKTEVKRETNHESEKDPIFDTFMTFHRQCGGEQNILRICESKRSFEKWQSLIQKKYEFDITRQSIFELDVSQVNGTVMKLGPNPQSYGKLLPSAGSSSVILRQKVMTALDILSENECENVCDENNSEFQDLKLKTEEEFYRGGKWRNFYFSEKQKTKPFIKRDKYEAVRTMETSQIKDPKSTCILVNLFHHP